MGEGAQELAQGPGGPQAPGLRGGLGRSQELVELTSARFLAALVVVLFHYLDFVPYPWGLAQLARQGQAGVGFFFVLSGFVLAYNYHGAFAAHPTSERLRSFYAARLARIFPLHVVALVAITPLVGWPELLPWLLNLAMAHALVPVQRVIYPWNVPSWSISCEAVFYLAFPFLLPRIRRPARWLLPLWVAGGASCLALSLGFSELAGKVSPMARGWEFAIGCAIGVLYMGGFRFQRPNRALAVGLAGTLALCFLPFLGGYKGYLVWLLAQYVLFTPFFALTILALASGPTFASGLLVKPWMRHLGLASYALYITHWIPLYLLRHDHAPGWPLAYMAGSLVLASVLHRWVEAPAREWLRTALGGKPAG
jgi:peptidoglycan/LPS O-acetylase OafA/YrhL